MVEKLNPPRSTFVSECWGIFPHWSLPVQSLKIYFRELVKTRSSSACAIALAADLSADCAPIFKHEISFVQNRRSTPIRTQ